MRAAASNRATLVQDSDLQQEPQRDGSKTDAPATPTGFYNKAQGQRRSRATLGTRTYTNRTLKGFHSFSAPNVAQPLRGTLCHPPSGRVEPQRGEGLRATIRSIWATKNRVRSRRTPADRRPPRPTLPGHTRPTG